MFTTGHFEWYILTTPIKFAELSATPDAATVPTNTLSLYALDNGSGVSNLYFLDDAGVEHDLGAASAHPLLDGSVHTDTADQDVTRGSLIYGNSTPAWDELVVGTAGQILTTDGTDVSWDDPATIFAHDLLDASINQDTVANTVVEGDLIYGNSTPAWDVIPIGTEGYVLSVVGGVPVWAEVNLAPTGSNALISGGQVVWVGGLSFLVNAATYRINGTVYTSAADTVTCDAADASNPRIDIIALNTSSAVEVIKGTAAASPAAPDVDPLTQLALTFVLIDALATTPTLTTESIYEEDVEWTTTAVGGTINTSSTNDPYAGSVSIEATNAVATDYVKFVEGGSFSLLPFDSLTFLLKFKAAWPNPKSLSIYWQHDSGGPSGMVTVGSIITIKSGQYGLDDSDTTNYQGVTIPISSFGIADPTDVAQLIIEVGGGGGSIGFFIDNIVLQGGLTIITPTDHSALTNLDWTVSGHTGTASSIPVFDSSGLAAEVASYATADWLTQYALLAGRSGGQVLIGGTGSGDNLTLKSTSHATKGSIIIQAGDDIQVGATPGAGTSGYLLESQGSGSSPEWVTAAGIDSTAIHDNVANEISALTEKGTPAGADLVIIEDSAASYVKKKVQVTNLGGGGSSLDQMPCFWKMATISNLAGLAIALGAGDYTLGLEFQVGSASLTCTGARFDWYGGEGSQTIRLKLWQKSATYYTMSNSSYSTTPLGSVDVSVNAAGLYEASWDEGDSTLEPFKCYIVSAYYVSGSKYIKMNAADWTNTYLSGTYWGGLRIENLRCYGAGDNVPNTFDSATRTPIEPIFDEMGN